MYPKRCQGSALQQTTKMKLVLEGDCHYQLWHLSATLLTKSGYVQRICARVQRCDSSAPRRCVGAQRRTIFSGFKIEKEKMQSATLRIAAKWKTRTQWCQDS